MIIEDLKKKIEQYHDETEEVVKFINLLKESTKNNKNTRCIHTESQIEDGLKVDNWKFNESSYEKHEKNPLVTMTRGLFTINDKKIFIRGYDKFFNVDEIPCVKIEELKKTTIGPYYVTIKHNGCLIFVGAINQEKLLICSKNSTEKKNQKSSHASEGRKRVYQTLEHNKIDKLMLSKFLYDYNLTLVLELCDDEFEEHIFSYKNEKKGLYLHGINYNTIQFQTVKFELLHELAQYLGFKTVDYQKLDTFDDFMLLTNQVKKTGTFNGNEVEGFVIRCKIKDENNNKIDYFFKYKFEYPYNLFRRMREATKKLLDNVPIESIKIKDDIYIIKNYLIYVQEFFKKNPDSVSDFKKGYGIIGIRESFFDAFKIKNNIDLLNFEINNLKNPQCDSIHYTNKYLLVPISVIGCGKTLVFTTLSILFENFSFLQNDDIGKSSKLKFVDNCLRILVDKNVILAERNNSLYGERSQFFDNLAKKKKSYLNNYCNLIFIGLNFVPDLNYDDLWRITFDRVVKRGDNHQSIKSASNLNLSTSVMRGFMNRFQPLNIKQEPDSNFDLVINLSLHEKNSSLENVQTIIYEISKNYPEIIGEIPSVEKISLAFEKALNYKPTFTKIISNNKPKYYAISIDRTNVLGIIDTFLFKNSNWTHFKQNNRIFKDLHVTLAHILNFKGCEKKLQWKSLKQLFKIKCTNENCHLIDFYADIRLNKVVISDKHLICITVSINNIYSSEKKIEKIEFLNKHLHITIGTFSENIKAFESNKVLESIYDDEKQSYISNEPSKIEIFDFPTETFLHNQQLYCCHI